MYTEKSIRCRKPLMPAFPTIPLTPSHKYGNADKNECRYSRDKGRGSENVSRPTFGAYIDAASNKGVVSLTKQRPRGILFTVRHLQSNATDSKRQMPRGADHMSVGQKGEYAMLLEN
ncbi:MAG: hypothetical protein OEY16_02105, partial [Alphaproteobacteria bacterium]|nr:hypothetical protein [Alphaproteobacteria bacterium]